MPHLNVSLARVTACAIMLATAACGESREHARADSIKAAAATEQLALATTLAAQKDSLMNVVMEADQFITQIDSQVSRVKGLKARDRRKEPLEGPLQEQLAYRKEMLLKVQALVERAQRTARQLEAARQRESRLRDSLNRDEQMIAELGRTVQRQAEQIAGLETTVAALRTTVAGLSDSTVKLGRELKVAQSSSARVYYIIGSERELLEKGVVVREGGVNLLVARAGKTLQPARELDPSVFVPVDARELRAIEVPDTTRRYTIVSRHSLDDAEVQERDRSTFRGDLRIADATRFWAPSRYLIIMQR